MNFQCVRLSRWIPPIRPSAFAVLIAAALSACVGGSGTVPAQPVTQGPGAASDRAASASRERSRPQPLATISIDVRGYMAAAIDKGSNPIMLCKAATGPNAGICLTSKREGSSTGEVAIFYDHSNGIVDHIAITSYQHGTDHGADAAQFIGVIRNYTGNGGFLRCFSTYDNSSQTCTAPANSFFVPQGVPYTMSDVPIVTWQAVEDSSNGSTGWSAKEPVAGGKITTTGGSNNYDSFGVERMSASCVQSPQYGGPTPSEVLVAYVKNVPFGQSSSSGSGNGVGTQDALLIDTFGSSQSERYFYVQGLGRVAEGTAQYNSNTGLYTVSPTHVVHNYMLPLTNDIKIDDDNPEPQCPQGSAVALWGY